MQTQTKHILVVDDDQTITRGLTSLFSQAGYLVRSAASGPQALEMLAPLPDLVVLDLILPEMDGYEVCRHIRRQPAYIPILMLTARDQSSDKILGLELGADVYVTKPFEPHELLAQVRALFRTLEGRERDAAEHPLTCGPIQVFESQHHVMVNGQAIELTPKEYELLCFFVRQPGRIFGRETLLREIWGYQFEGDSRVVDVTVQRLRAKIEADPAHPTLLHTVRGFGYRLVEPGHADQALR
jgi:two-component system alkaline phosphatase synthesis response regulator PhoP